MNAELIAVGTELLLGQIIDEMPEPTTDRVLDRMKRFEG